MAESEQVIAVDPVAMTADSQATHERCTLEQIITLQLETLRIHHRAVLETNGPDAVHKMRVTTRRLQAALDLLEREFHARRIKKRLRKWRRMLSLVRNYDVFLIMIEREAAAGGSARREQFELVKAILHKRRERRAAEVRRYLEKVNIDRIAAKLGLSMMPLPTRVSEQAAVESDDTIKQALAEPHADKRFVVDESRIAGHIAERLEERVAEFQALADQSHPSTNAQNLHQLRIAAKRVRYLLEIISELGYGDASRALGWLRTLQDRIGDWHDLEALEEEIIQIVSRRRFMKKHLAESGRMLQAAAHFQKKKESLVIKLFPIRVPRTLSLTSQRMAKALRHHAAQAKEQNPSIKNPAQ